MAAYEGAPQLALQLISTILPPLAERLHSSLQNLVRDHRKSGSDIFVEQDLAAVFGRVYIDAELERNFRAVTNVARFVPLHDGCEIGLHTGPGPTMRLALRQRDFMATMIQLSLLGWTNERKRLADLIAKAFRTRSEVQKDGEVNLVQADAVMQTLYACSSQCSGYDWNCHIDAIDQKLANAFPSFETGPGRLAVTPSIMLAAPDMFRLVQTLPEDRRMVVTGGEGIVTLIVWAHVILGFNVAVLARDSDRPHDVATCYFGDPSKVSVEIMIDPLAQDFIQVPTQKTFCGTTIDLLDATTTVIFGCRPQPYDWNIATASERCRIKGCISTNLRRRAFQNSTLDEANLIKAAHLSVVAVICLASGTGPFCMPHLEPRRLIDAAAVLLHPIKLDMTIVHTFVPRLMHMPTKPDTWLAQDIIPCRADYIAPQSWYHSDLLGAITEAAFLIWLFAHVDNIEENSDMSVFRSAVLDPSHEVFNAHKSLWGRNARALEISGFSDCYQAMLRVSAHPFGRLYALGLCLSQHMFEDAMMEGHMILVSDFGWSIYLDIMHNPDASAMDTRLVRIARGTPTSLKTGETARVIREGHESVNRDVKILLQEAFCAEEHYPQIRISRKELWTIRNREFALSFLFSLFDRQSTSEQPSASRKTSGRTLQALASPTTVFELIHVLVQPKFETCEHSVTLTGLKLSLQKAELVEAADTVADPQTAVYGEARICRLPQRVLNCWGDKSLKFLAVACYGARPHFFLRRGKVCNECALRYAVARAKEWVYKAYDRYETRPTRIAVLGVPSSAEIRIYVEDLQTSCEFLGGEDVRIMTVL